jgi:hypothetical protein
MPYIAPTTNLADAFSAAGGALFPDPSKVGAAMYQGAHARKTDLESQALEAQARAKASLGGLISQATANPTPENIAHLTDTALAAGHKAQDVAHMALVGASLAQKNGVPPAIAQGALDAALSRVGGQAYGSTPTGHAATLSNDLARANVAIKPGMAEVALKRDEANNNNVVQDTAGNMTRQPLNTPLAPGAVPVATATARRGQDLEVLPHLQEQDRKERQMRDEPRTYNNGAGQTFTRQFGGPMPPDGFLPVEQGGPVLSSIIGAPRRSFVVPAQPGQAAGQSGRTTATFGPLEAPPPGAIPLDPQNPGANAGNAALFSPPPGLGDIITAAPAPAPAPLPPTGVGDTANAAMPAPAPAPVAAPAPRQDPLAATGASIMAGQNQGPPETIKPGEHKAITAQIDAMLKERNKQLSTGRISTTRDYVLDEDLRSAIYGRASEMVHQRGTPTYNNFPGAVNAAWTEFAPRMENESHTMFWGGGPSVIRLKAVTAPATAAPAPVQNQQTGPVPPAGVSPSPPAGLPRTTPPPPVPAPGGLSAVLSGPSRYAYPGGNVPQQQAGPPPAPPTPAQRTPNTVYLMPNGKPGLWSGTGWRPAS